MEVGISATNLFHLIEEYHPFAAHLAQLILSLEIIDRGQNL